MTAHSQLRSSRASRDIELTVCIDPGGRGAWEVTLPEGETIVCQTLDDAKRIAYLGAAQRRPCQLVIRDAYHRVLRRERINGRSSGP